MFVLYPMKELRLERIFFFVFILFELLFFLPPYRLIAKWHTKRMTIKRKDVKTDFFFSFHTHSSIDIKLGACRDRRRLNMINVNSNLYLDCNKKK